MQKALKIQWKWRELLVALGGPSKIPDHIAARGVIPPSSNTIKGWVTRNSVPGAWAPLLILIAQEERSPETGKPVLPKVSNLRGGVGR